MSKARNTGNLNNAIQVSETGAISFMSGSTMLMTLNTTGQMSGSAPVLSASYADIATTASYATNFTVAGNLVAQTLVVQTITSSVDFVTGSTRFGSISGNTHQFTGSVSVSGSVSTMGDVSAPMGTISSAYASIYNYITFTNMYGSSIQANTGTAWTPLTYAASSHRWDTSGSIRMTLTNAGLLGIGTTTPSRPLSISGTGTDGTQVQINGTGDSAGIKLVPVSGDNWEIQANTSNQWFVYNRTDSAYRFLIDENGNVGVGTTSPNSLFEINKSSNAGSGASFPRINVINSLATQGDGSSTYNFADIHLSSGNGAVDMYLSTTYAAGAWAPAGIINVATNHDLQFKTNNTEKMRITSGGNVGIGTTTPNYALVVKSSTAGSNRIQLLPTTDYGFFQIDNSGGTVYIGTDNSTAGVFGQGNYSMNLYNSYASNINLYTGGTLRVQVNSNGVKFQNGASSLNYYEEGNWTPQLAWTSGGSYVMSGVNSGRYVRIGNIVHLQFQMQWSSLSGTVSGTLRVNGIPFTAGGTCRSAGSICANNAIALNSGYTWLGLTIDPNASFIYIIENAQSGGYSHSPNVAGSGIVYSLQISYSIA